MFLVKSPGIIISSLNPTRRNFPLAVVVPPTLECARLSHWVPLSIFAGSRRLDPVIHNTCGTHEGSTSESANPVDPLTHQTDASVTEGQVVKGGATTRSLLLK